MDGVKTKIYENYADFLASPEWAKIREDALKRGKYKCENCGSKSQLQVHHKRYRTWGAEQPEDLMVLCRECHRAAHDLDPNKTSRKKRTRQTRRGVLPATGWKAHFKSETSSNFSDNLIGWLVIGEEFKPMVWNAEKNKAEDATKFNNFIGLEQPDGETDGDIVDAVESIRDDIKRLEAYIESFL